MSEPQWTEVDVPRGSFISWGTNTGQHVTGRVMAYEPQGGTDFAGNPCPQLSVELTAPAASVNKEGARTDFAVGELVVLNAGQVSLKRALQAAQPQPGELVKITLASLARTANGTVKEFTIAKAPGSAPAGGAAAGGFGAGPQADEPPF